MIPYWINQALGPAPKRGAFYEHPYHPSPYSQPTHRGDQNAICGPEDNLIFLYKRPAEYHEYSHSHILSRHAENYPVVCTPGDWAPLGNGQSRYRERRSSFPQKLSELVEYLRIEVKDARAEEDNERLSHAEFQLRKLKECADEWIQKSPSWDFRGDDEVVREACVSIMTSLFYPPPPPYVRTAGS